MDRRALIAEFQINNEKVFIATVHLESLANARYRKVQLDLISMVLRLSPHSFLMGDFNFDSIRDFHGGPPKENKNIAKFFPPPKFMDVWPAIHPDKRGFTFDTKENKMLHKADMHNDEQMRYDRIIMGSEPINTCKWKPTSIEIIGAEPIKGLTLDVILFPSDHFGLLAEFTYEENVTK